MPTTDASSPSINIAPVLSLFSTATARDRLMANWNEAQTSEKLHTTEATLNYHTCHRPYRRTLGLLPCHAMENGLKNPFSLDLLDFNSFYSYTESSDLISLENPTDIRGSNFSRSHHPRFLDPYKHPPFMLLGVDKECPVCAHEQGLSVHTWHYFFNLLNLCPSMMTAKALTYDQATWRYLASHRTPPPTPNPRSPWSHHFPLDTCHFQVPYGFYHLDPWIN